MAGVSFFNKDGNSSRIRHCGADVLDLLNRLTTADMNGLAPGGSRRTALLTERGRIVDVFLTAKETDTSFLLISDLMDAAPLTASIDKYTIIEDAAMQDVSSQTTQTLVMGENAEKIAKEATKEFGGGAFFGGWEVLDAWEVVASEDKAKAVAEFMSSEGESMTSEAFKTLRIELGIPFPGSELDERTNPLEARLENIISFDKGCYIGQEVVARLDTYEKVQRRLMGLRADSPLTEGSELTSQEGTSAGRVCSTGKSGKFGYIALGFIRSRWAIPNTALTTDEGIKCMVAQLPFELPDKSGSGHVA